MDVAYCISINIHRFINDLAPVNDHPWLGYKPTPRSNAQQLPTWFTSLGYSLGGSQALKASEPLFRVTLWLGDSNAAAPMI